MRIWSVVLSIAFWVLFAAPFAWSSGRTDCEAYERLIEQARQEKWNEERLQEELARFMPRMNSCIRYVEAQRAKARCESVGGIWRWIDYADDEGVCLAAPRPIPCCVENPFAANDMCPPCDPGDDPPDSCPPGDPSCCDWRTDPLCPRPEGTCAAFMSADRSNVPVGETVRWQWSSSDAAYCRVSIEEGFSVNRLSGQYSTVYSAPGDYEGVIECESVDQGYGTDTCRDTFVVHVYEETPAGYCAVNSFYADYDAGTGDWRLRVNARGVRGCWVWVSSPECLNAYSLTDLIDEYLSRGRVEEFWTQAWRLPLEQVSRSTLEDLGVLQEHLRDVSSLTYEWYDGFPFAFLAAEGSEVDASVPLAELFGPNFVTGSVLGDNLYYFALVCQCEDMKACEVSRQGGETLGALYYQDGDSCMVAQGSPATYDAPVFYSPNEIPLLGDRETWGDMERNFLKCWAWRLGFVVIDQDPSAWLGP